MKSRAYKKLKMHKIRQKDLVLSRQTMINMLCHSPDPYMTVLYTLQIDNLKAFIHEQRESTGKRITLNHVMNKVIALCIDKHRVFNRVVLDNNLYELEEIHVTNTFMLPGPGNVLTVFIVENPHEKTLSQIVDDFDSLKKQKREEHSQRPRDYLNFLSRVYGRTALYKLVSEKRAFKIVYRRGINSNIGISNVGYGGKADYIIVKPAIFFLRTILRISVHGSQKTPVLENGKLVIKETIPLTVSADHRVLDGYHLHLLGAELHRITSAPQKYL
jgi:pyruvate/2-oxoglutarate dehydrogenase complex dihydrolipoamide acyltransferase (E2) component